MNDIVPLGESILTMHQEQFSLPSHKPHSTSESAKRGSSFVDTIQCLPISEQYDALDHLTESLKSKEQALIIRISEICSEPFSEPLSLRSDVNHKEVFQVFEEVLATLTPREEKVIKMRFGLGESDREQTFEEIGRHFLLTRQRIYQIEAKAQRKLRHPSRSRRLKAFLEGKAS